MKMVAHGRMPSFVGSHLLVATDAVGICSGCEISFHMSGSEAPNASWWCGTGGTRGLDGDDQALLLKATRSSRLSGLRGPPYALGYPARISAQRLRSESCLARFWRRLYAKAEEDNPDATKLAPTAVIGWENLRERLVVQQKEMAKMAEFVTVRLASSAAATVTWMDPTVLDRSHSDLSTRCSSLAPNAHL